MEYEIDKRQQKLQEKKQVVGLKEHISKLTQKDEQIEKLQLQISLLEIQVQKEGLMNQDEKCKQLLDEIEKINQQKLEYVQLAKSL